MTNTRPPRIGEPIAVTLKEHGFFPKTFVWRGRRHDVRAIERCWTVARRRWRGRIEQHCFRVRTDEATFEISQDLSRDTWQIERVLAARQ